VAVDCEVVHQHQGRGVAPRVPAYPAGMRARVWVGVLIAVAVVAVGGIYSIWNGRLRPTDIRMVRPEVANRLDVELTTCNAERQATVAESDEAVFIRVMIRNNHAGLDCADGMTITLERPLGNRVVVDVSGWDRVEVQD